MKDTVGQRDQTSVWDQGEGGWDGDGCCATEGKGTGWRELSRDKEDRYGMEGAVTVQTGWAQDRGFLVEQRGLSQDGVNGQGMEGSITGWGGNITGWRGPLWDAGHHRGVEGTAAGCWH